MRIRKRTPGRAASPGPSPALAPSPLMPQQPKELPREEEEDDGAEEKRVILLVAEAGGRGDVRVPDPVQADHSAAADGVAKPEAPPQDATPTRCSRNDGKRWRCKSAAVPGYLFCDRHVAWSARQRQPRATTKRRKEKDNGNGGGGFEAVAEEEEEEAEVDKHADDGSAGKPQPMRRGDDDDDDEGFYYYYGGFQPGERKRARAGGPGPAGSMNRRP